MSAPRVRFDRGPLGTGTAFKNARRVITATSPDEVPQAFVDLQDAQGQGHWLAGFASYELGYLMSRKLVGLLPEVRQLPLLQFGVFDDPVAVEPLKGGRAELTSPLPMWSRDRYARAFEVVHEYIKAGDVYQANLTFPMQAQLTGTPEALYAALCARQSVPYGALVQLGGPALLSRSPELFFSLSAKGKLTARPMKGTAPRGHTSAEDDALRDALATSEKNRAENLMIVDLLRNDLSRISQIGSVRVPELFQVERYATLHQMTSRITAQINDGTSIAELFRALFPCGSITGAPKIRAMEILRDLEAGPRDGYCGAIGWIAPDGAMEFNVAIRTLMCGEDGSVSMNVGGGVVYDSTAEDEYDEALLKAKFADLN
ncbi:MAG: aminodeoxychorismate synthase component I [Litoreibacter sp.]|uniref:aminodeoxychorismate synthase component I n=1 Tax=Litoreibacter sp. TaxID=1969459 RepID=UPI00329A2237